MTSRQNENENESLYEEIPVTLRLNKSVTQVGRLIAKHYDEDFDTFVSEEVSKIIVALAESSSIISDELKQQIQSLLKDEEI